MIKTQYTRNRKISLNLIKGGKTFLLLSPQFENKSLMGKKNSQGQRKHRPSMSEFTKHQGKSRDGTGGVAVDPQSGALPSLAWPRKTRRLWQVPSLRSILHSPSQEERRQPTKEMAQAVTQNYGLFKNRQQSKWSNRLFTTKHSFVPLKRRLPGRIV